MKRNFKISSFRINPSTITNNASFRFRVYINLINYFERVFRGVLIFVACYYIEQSSTYCRAIDDNSNSSSFFPILNGKREMSTLSETNHSLHHAVPSTISNRTFRHPSANSLSSIDSRFARHVRRYRDIRLLRVVFQSMLQPSVRWQHTRLTGKKDYSREKI